VEQKARGAPEKQGMLLLDHLTDISQQKQNTRSSMNRYLGFTSAGMTSELQVLDVVANTPFKDHLKQYYRKWLLTGDHALTPAEGLRSLVCASLSVKHHGRTAHLHRSDCAGF